MRIGYEAKRVFHNKSGLGNFSRNLIRALSKNYPENEYLLYSPANGKVKFGDDLFNIKTKHPRVSDPLFSMIWRQYFLASAAQRDMVDVFHGLSQELPSGLKKRRIPSVLSVHDLIFMRYPHLYSRIDRNTYIQKLRLSCLQADRIVAISDQTRRDLIEFLKIPDDKIQVIYQGVDPVYRQKIESTVLEKIRSKYKLPQRFVLYVGTLEDRKNAAQILNICQHRGIPLVVVGKARKYWKNHLKNKVGLKKELLFHPVVSDNYELAALYQMADIFAYPSVFEGFGIPVLEALVSGTPVITTNSSSLPEVAGPGSLLIPAGDETALDNAVIKLWDSPMLCEEMKYKGLTFAENFADEKIAAQWQQLYQSLL